MGRYPVDITTILVGVHVACAILTAFVFCDRRRRRAELCDVRQRAGLARPNLATRHLRLHPSAVGYALLWFAIEMYMLFFFGREVERFVGRRAYIWLYALLLLGRR